MIGSKAYDTLQWVFDPPPTIQPVWTKIPSWLEACDGVYWISGKAGSGKSTLMKWLLHEDRTTQLLESWAGSKVLLKAQYFFWSSGTSEQKTLSGLLRSLLYDLLRQWPDPIFEISASKWRSYDLELAHFPSWSCSDLVNALRVFLQSLAENAKVCLFIDGLDELAGDDKDRLEILGLLRDLSKQIHVKICVSSRPWQIFQDYCADCPQLRLEDLTRKDIRDYITETFEVDERCQLLRRRDQDTYTQLIFEVTDKAKGVWLWVIIVTHSLLRVLRNEDTVMDLLYRLRQIPEKLESYFLQMFSNIEHDYRLKSLALIKLALSSSNTLSLMTCSILDEQMISGEQNQEFTHNVPLQALSQDQLSERLSRAQRRVNTMSMGLLETVHRTGYRHPFYQHEVEFLHRTARDFFFNTKTQILVNMDLVASFDVQEFLCKALLVQMKMLDNPTDLLLADFMHCATLLEEESSAILLSLLNDLNDFLVTQRFAKWSNDLNGKSPVRGWGHRQQIPAPLLGSVPLLSLAIQYGLDRFVRSHIQSTPHLVTEKSDRPLLDYALRRRIYSIDLGQSEQLESPLGGANDQPDVELVLMILERGGDPNGKLGERTVWKYFMRFLDCFSSNLQCLDKQSMQPWLQVTELLIRYGAVRVLESETTVPRQSSGRTRVNLG
ncbi:hypothetical protein PENFLA_c012G09388 [Penicillium flavigenum]|uniref:NACHT domain-containing protein n=1 Tax=Penicillium flavigenum TaxID=254877 RepID=A0A1V6T9L4_9EURO|nr:hypothetical protein PENFLA_c012G09388 [Penicillium flavigenum]